MPAPKGNTNARKSKDQHQTGLHANMSMPYEMSLQFIEAMAHTMQTTPDRISEERVIRHWRNLVRSAVEHYIIEYLPACENCHAEISTELKDARRDANLPQYCDACLNIFYDDEKEIQEYEADLEAGRDKAQQIKEREWEDEVLQRMNHVTDEYDAYRQRQEEARQERLARLEHA